MIQFSRSLADTKLQCALVFFLVAFQLTYGQLTGSTTVTENTSSVYTYSDGYAQSGIVWTVTGGTITSTYNSGIVYKATVLWGSAGSGYVRFRSLDAMEFLDITKVAAPPSAPTAPTIANYIGYTRLTRSTPPTGETWYWQITSTGTSTSNSASYVDRTSGTVYYLRYYKSATSQWSTATPVNYTVTPLTAPTTPTVTNYPGYTRLTRGTPPSGVTWYWQSSSSGTSTANSSTYVDMTTGTTYYLKAYVSTVNLWSSVTTVTYTVNPLGPSFSDENYIHTTTPSVASTDVSALTDDQKMEAITYYDGLGRPMQSIGIMAGVNSEDIITHIGYDAYGRQDKDYLPYASSSGIGSYRTGALSETNTHYLQGKYSEDINSAAPNPYSQKEFEDSPLNRVLEQTAPGKDWNLGTTFDANGHSNGHTIKFGYNNNSDTDQVRVFGVLLIATPNGTVMTYVPTLITNGPTGFYAAGKLYKTVTKDENWTSGTDHTTEEFKNKQGQVILKRTYTNSATHDTYYVYDNYGNLSYVLSPKVDYSSGVTTNDLNDLCYQYVYDERNRLVEKKVPGKGWEYIVYNKLDQPIMTQDTNLKNQEKWLFTKYDAFGRVAYTGVDTGNTSSRETLQSAANAVTTQFETKNPYPTTYVGTQVFYTNSSYPTSFDEVQTINYYDNYNFDRASGNSEASYTVTPITDAKGLATGSKVRVLGTTDWITTVTYYDTKGQPIYVYSFNDYLDTTDKVKSQLDFTGRVLESTTVHSRTNYTDITTVDTYTYDHQGRLVSQKNKIGNNDEELIVLNTYDDLGQLEKKKVGGDVAAEIKNSIGLQTVDYTYNIRGWLKGINNTGGSNSSITLGPGDLFGFQISYNDPVDTTKKLYNGNISQTLWKTTSVNNTTNPVANKYTYSYDALNRITSAIDTNNSNYNLSFVDYDKNGNILHLNRNGNRDGSATVFGEMDHLTYYYNGNQLHSITDTSVSTGFNDGHVSDGIYNNGNDDYTYDANGNMLRDYNKGITSNITYNQLNLPTSVTLSGGNISYIYDATGVKLRKTVSTGTTIDYAGNYVYENGVLKFFSTPEGYVDVPSGNKYVYQYKDHLGNIRLSYKDISATSTPNLQIQEENNYYPFGLKHKGYNATINSSNIALKRKFAGKELQDDNVNGNKLDWYDFGARNYDAALGRWMSLDPLSEKYSNLSPFSYVANNVVNAIDPDGRLIIFVGGLQSIRGIPIGNLDNLLFPNTFYKTDVFKYWRTYGGERNSFGQQVDMVQLFSNLHHDDNFLFASGSNSYISQASRRQAEGRIAAKTFYKKWKKGKVELADGEAIRIVSHSQGGAFAAGFADQLRTYKDETGESIFNLEFIWYLNPHQPGDIEHPKGIPAFQYSLYRDAISSRSPIWLPNGGSGLELIKGVLSYYTGDIFGEDEAEGPKSNRGGHNVTDNHNNLLTVANDFCKRNPDKCFEITIKDDNKQ